MSGRLRPVQGSVRASSVLLSRSGKCVSPVKMVVVGELTWSKKRNSSKWGGWDRSRSFDDGRQNICKVRTVFYVSSNFP